MKPYKVSSMDCNTVTVWQLGGGVGHMYCLRQGSGRDVLLVGDADGAIQHLESMIQAIRVMEETTAYRLRESARKKAEYDLHKTEEKARLSSMFAKQARQRSKKFPRSSA